MKSPFPGMDPYLEQHWRDVHSSLIIYARDQIQPDLPGSLFARVEERVYVESGEGPERSMYPDLRVVEHGRRGAAAAVAVQGEVDVAEPYILHVGDETVTETYIEIRDASSGNRVITVVEFLSPSNKIPGEGQDQFLKKREECRQAEVSLVEVDLLRGGKRIPGITADQIPAHLRTPYHVVVRRGWKPGEAEYYALPLRRKLRGVGIPLRLTDSDVVLDLQAIVEQCYRNGRYDTLNYQEELDPPLTGEDAAWADALLRAAAKRA